MKHTKKKVFMNNPRSKQNHFQKFTDTTLNRPKYLKGSDGLIPESSILLNIRMLVATDNLIDHTRCQSTKGFKIWVLGAKLY